MITATRTHGAEHSLRHPRATGGKTAAGLGAQAAGSTGKRLGSGGGKREGLAETVGMSVGAVLGDVAMATGTLAAPSGLGVN